MIVPLPVGAVAFASWGDDFLNLRRVDRTGTGPDFRDDRGVDRRTVIVFLLSCRAIDKPSAIMI